MKKKILITITIISLVLSMVLPVRAYGSGDISYEGRICRDLGILKGSTGVVDNEYLETRPSRLQAAIMFLRLKGLEQKALAYSGGSNFKDAASVTWKEGRNVLSYLKDHPELGWIGDGTNFLPNSPIDAKAYYKVLLESLGYRQKIDGDGDFDWSSVLEFAEAKGLKKVAGVKNFTVGDLATATVEALKTKMKNSSRNLIEYLVDIGDVDKRDAAALDLYTEGIDAEIKSVRAISNSKVEVVFADSVNGSDATDEELYTIGHLDIKNVSMKNQSSVIIDTSAMSESSTYTLEFDNKNYSFRGLKKDSMGPKLIKAECRDTDLVELTFDRVLDNETAQDSDIYTIEDASVKSAELDSTNTKVRLTTSGIQSGRSYELKIRGIKNGDGVMTKSITERFAGRKDTVAPKLNKLTVLNNVKLLLEFTDSNGLDKKTAQDIDNYRITYSGGSLDVESVQVKDRDNDGLWDTVELVTETQDSGQRYTLIINEIADASVLGNRTAKETKREFRGKSADKSGPTVARNPKAVTNTMVEIEFADANALDIESACDIDNYEIDDLDIIDARIKDKDDLYSAEGRTVVLITDEMEKSESYTLKIYGIQDEFGNEMKSSSTSKKYRFRGLGEDRTPPYITHVECIDSRTVELNFDNLLDEESAENIANYRIDSLALVTKAELQEDGMTVRLKVSSLSSDRNHTVLLNNIKDLSGNTISNVSVSILYNGNLYDDDAPEISDIEAVNKKEVWVSFEEEIYTENAKMEASGLEFYQVGSVLDEGRTVVMTTKGVMEDKDYEVTSLTGIWDLRNNRYELENDLEFYGTSEDNDPPEVDDWEQMNVRTFRVIFTEPVLIKGSGVSGIKNPSGVGIGWTAVLNPDEEDTEEAYSTVDYVANGDIPADREFRFNFTEMVSDYAGLGAYDEDDDHGTSSTVLESYMEDDEEPYIEYVEALTRNKVQIVFSEEIRSGGSYKITYTDEDGDDRTIDIRLVEIDSKDKTRVNIYTEDEMSDEFYYVLIPKSAAADIAGNRLDIDDLEIEFEGTNIMSSDYIQGVEVLNAYTLRVSKSSKIYKVSSLYELDASGNEFGGNLMDSVSRVSDNIYKVISKKPLLRDVRYEITVDGLEYKFYGGVSNGDIELELPEMYITYDGIDTDKHYVEVIRADGSKLDVDKEDNHFEIDSLESLKNGDILYVYVKWISDKTVLYGTRIKVEGMPAASSSKEITSFSLEVGDMDIAGSIDEDDGIIRVTVPYGTKLDSAKANFKYSEGAVVKIGPDTQVSGETHDFSKLVTYTVIAEDGSKKNYEVRITEEESKYEKKITRFAFENLKTDVVGKINENDHLITLTVPYGTDLTSLKPTIETSPGTTVFPESGKENNFSGPVTYKVTAKDGSSQKYTVDASVSKSSDNYVESFRFKDVAAYDTVITAGKTNTIITKVPYGTVVSELIPIITISEHATITPESGKVNDFTNEVTYTVTAEDGTVRDYTVKVDIAPNNEKQINEFGFADPKASGIINEAANTISVKVPYGTALNGLKAEFTSSPGSKVFAEGKEQKSSETPVNFSAPVKYIVEAQDGTKRDYTVTVTAAKADEISIESFSLNSLNPVVNGIVDNENHIIKLSVPKETELRNLAASFRYFGKSIEAKEAEASEWMPQVSGVTLNDFSKNIIYRLTPHDGTPVIYTVIVTVAESGE